MTTALVHRPGRITRPRPAPAALAVEPPPLLPEGGGSAGLQALLPLAGAGSSMTLMLVFRGSPLAAVGALVMVLTILATGVLVVSQRGQATRNRRAQRERYLDHLEDLRERLRFEEDDARAAARTLDPPPSALVDVVRDPARLWERRRRDRDFLAPRLGTGALPGRALELRDQGSAVQPSDPFMLAEARLLARRFAVVPDLPLCLPLDLAGDVSVVGPREEVLAVARALLLQVSALHAPEDVALAVARPASRAEDWEWAQWLPHVADPDQRGAAGPLVRVADGLGPLADLLAHELEERASTAARARRTVFDDGSVRLLQRLVVLVDTDGAVAAPLPLPDRNAAAVELGITVVHLVSDRLAEPGEVTARVTVGGGRLVVEQLRGEPVRVEGTPDEVPVGLADGLARLLAPLRLSEDSYEETGSARSADALELLELPDVADGEPGPPWRVRSERDLLRVPLGIDDDGRAVVLDLKEPAQLGMGPHGLCVGATGSGKSELLRTLVLSLLATHPPEQLSMVLVDYKGGATFAPFAGLPHVAGLITNLADDLALVERAHSSLAGEVKRRQQVLKDAGVSDIIDHGLLRATRPDLPPLPHLLVIVDEFGELLTAEPDFIELFLSIGRIGRSIGVHLLLSSQRIEGGKLKGLDTYLSYRLGLRTFSEAESRTVLDTPDAFALPALPGYGYLKVDTSTYRRFKAAYVSGPVPGPADEQAEQAAPALVVPLPRSGRLPSAQPADGRVARLPDRTSGPTLLSTLVQRLAGAAPANAPVWLPPLPPAIALDAVAGPVRPGPGGLRLPTGSPLRVPVGLLDDPARQWQGRWDLDLTRAGGHLAVVGGPRSGRSTLLRTLVLSLALTASPREVAVYAVDLLGGGLLPLADLPHVGGVASRGDRERVRRTLEEVVTMLETRERVFREHQLDSVEALRAAHAEGRVPELPVADVVVVLDGYGQLSGDFEDVEPLVHALAARGGSYGVHLVVTVGRWGEVRAAQQAAFGTRVELRLNDPGDSGVGRKLAATLSAEQPGRALTDAGLVGHVALPRIDGRADPASGSPALAQAVAAVRAAAAGPSAPPVRVLPRVLPDSHLPGPAVEPVAVPLGLCETDLSSVGVDLFAEDQHLVVLGDGGSGKTNVLRLLARGLVARYSADELVVAVVDPRRGLAGVVPEDHLGGYAGGAPAAAQLAAAVTRELERRAADEPGRGTATAALAGPGAPAGPRIVLLVDDLDVLTAAGSNPLAPLLPHLASGRDLGLHVVATRRVAGAARGLFEPFLLAVRESGATGLLLSGDRSEGQLLGGVRARDLPPGRGLLVRAGGAVRTVQTAWTGDPA